MTVPIFSAVTSRKFGGSCSAWCVWLATSCTKGRWITFLSFFLKALTVGLIRGTSVTLPRRKGPCYRTPAVPSRSAGVSIFCRGRLALARTQPQRTPRTYFGLSFPAAVAPTIPMTVPRAITSAPVVPVTVPAPLRLSAGADIRRSRRSCRRSRRSRPGSSPAFAALEMTGVPLWSHGRAR
jgi:hypothetical protein